MNGTPCVACPGTIRKTNVKNHTSKFYSGVRFYTVEGPVPFDIYVDACDTCGVWYIDRTAAASLDAAAEELLGKIVEAYLSR